MEVCAYHLRFLLKVLVTYVYMVGWDLGCVYHFALPATIKNGLQKAYHDKYVIPLNLK